jgi:GT2 family glycosyltransferase
MEPAVSVIIPVKETGPLLHACLARLAAQTYRDFDIYVVPDAPVTLSDPAIHVIASGAVLPNRKRCLAAAASSAPIVALIDDDAEPEPGWLAAAVAHFADPAVVAAGGPGLTPPSASARERAGGAIFAARVVTAATRDRYVVGVRHDVESLPSCNLLMRRDAFVRAAATSLDVWPGEDLLTCMAATRTGGRIVYEPNARVFHHRRAVFGPHLAQVWRYALARGVLVSQQRRLLRSAYVIPAAFVLAHPLVAAAIGWRRTRGAGVAAVASYAALVAIDAWREGRAARANPWIVAAGIYLTHAVYGVGSILGFVRSARDAGR